MGHQSASVRSEGASNTPRLAQHGTSLQRFVLELIPRAHELFRGSTKARETSPATRYLALCSYGLDRFHAASLLPYMPSLACLPVLQFGDLWLLGGMYCWLLAGLSQPNEQILNCLLLASHTATGMDNHHGYILSCSAFLSLLPEVMGKGSGNLLCSDVWL